ncbi:MAG: hypothetical protein P1P80_09210 [ANME-2 cluster archaeon]|nr:hypothetical protein [ANME-2 cluster archaeon]
MNRTILLLTTGLLITSFIFPGPASADLPRYLHINEMTMEPKGPDAIFSVDYELDIIARLYVLFLGSGSIEPAIKDMFYDFDEIQIISIKENHAQVMVYNIGYQDNEIEGIYFYDSHRLGDTVDTFILFPNSENPERFYNVASTPNVFMR